MFRYQRDVIGTSDPDPKPRKVDKNVCPECGQERPGDDRVKAGMKCYFCSYGDQSEDKNDYPPSRHHLNSILGVKEEK